MSIKVIIADDHEIFRNGLELLIKNDPDLELIAEAENGAALLTQIADPLPDVILMDIQMPVMGGVEATKIILADHPDIKVIALTMYGEDQSMVDMLDAGSRGFILKNISREELATAIKSVYHGQSYFSNSTTKRMAQLIASSKARIKTGITELNNTEIEIIRLICQEYSSKQIADKLSLKPRTIENYREKIQEKIGTKNMVGIAVFAIKNGIYKP